MQTEKYKVTPVSILLQKEGSKFRSTSVNKQSSQKQLLNQTQKNKSVQIKDASFDRYLETTQNQKFRYNGTFKGQNESSKNTLPSTFVKLIRKTANDNNEKGDHKNSKSGFDQRLCLPHLSDKINKFDDFEQMNQEDSLTLTHRIPNNQKDRQNNKSTSPDRETLYNVASIQSNSRYSRLQKDSKISSQRYRKERNQSEFINFLDQGDSSLIEERGGVAEVQKKQTEIVHGNTERYIKTGDEDIIYSSRNIPQQKIRYNTSKQQNNNQTQFEEREGIPIKSSNTVGTDEAIRRQKRAKSQYEQPITNREISPKNYRIPQQSAMMNYNKIQNSNNQSNNFNQKKQNDNQIYQNYNVEYTLSSQLASKHPKKTTTYLHRSFQNKQPFTQQKSTDTSFQTRKQITNQLHDSILSNHVLSTSVDMNKSVLKNIANTTNMPTHNHNQKSKSRSPDVNQSLDLNTTFDISMQLKQSPSSPIASSQTRNFSNNKQSNKKLFKDSSQQQNNRYQTAKTSPFMGNSTQTIPNQNSNLNSAREHHLNLNQSNDRSTSLGNQTHQNIPQNKFQKLNFNQSLNSPQQHTQNNNMDDQSSKYSFSLLSARLQHSQNNQTHSSPRSATTTSTHHEKLIYKHVQLLLHQREGISSTGSSPIQKTGTLNVESILNGNEDCNRFLRHYFNKVDILFTSIERKDIDHIILLVANLLDVLVEMNEIHLFCQFVLFLGYTSKDFNHIDKAIFFFHQVDIISNIFRLWNMKAEALIRLAECAKELKLYDSSILLLKKGLQFVWIVKDHDRELAIYDNLGLNYFYLGDLENAFYYHEKFMKGEVEAEHTATKQLSIKNIEFFEMKQYRKQHKFTKLVMINLSLPIKNVFDSNEQSPSNKTSRDKKDKSKQNQIANSSFNQQNTSFNALAESHTLHDNQQNMIDLMKSQSGFLVVPLCDFDKYTTWKNCEGKKLIQKLVSSQEYEYIVSESKGNKESNDKPEQEKLNTENQDPTQSQKNKLQKKVIPRIQLPGILIKHNQTQKHEEFKQILHKMKISNYNLEEKVREMINDKTSLEQIMDKVEHNVKNQKSSQFQQQKVNINHLGEEFQSTTKKNQTDAYYLKKRYLQMLSEIIGDYVFKKVF